MTADKLVDIIKCGETTAVQFKQEFTSQKKMANEMVAMANTQGGVIIFGIEDKTGKLIGLSYEQLQHTSNELGNTANECVRPTIYITTEVVQVNGKHLLVCNIAEGANKPYKNLDGEIYVKQGADKRRVTENSEILSLFQQSQKYFPDQEGVADSSVEDIDTLALDRFFTSVYKKRIEDFGIPTEKLLHNIHITDENGRLTVAGALFFAQFPQQFRPVDVIKAVRFVGNKATTTEYIDSRDIEGTIPEMFEQAMMWLKSCLHSSQNGQSVNSIGKLEIPEIILEELLQNALVHRDLLKHAAIRLLVFDNRIEIINPGCLAGGLTVDEILLGNSFARNPLIANFCSKTMTYRGLGFGIPRSQEFDVKVEFVNDFAGNQFTARVWRNVAVNDTVNSENVTVNDKNVTVNDKNVTVNDKNVTVNDKNVTVNDKNVTVNDKNVTVNDIENDGNVTINVTERHKIILRFISLNGSVTVEELGRELNVVSRTIKRDLKLLQQQNIIKRVGSDKTGHWEIIKH